MKYEIIIGCEVHVQLKTKSKAFCSCENSFGGRPNSRVCPVCLGLPGALPVVNRAMVEDAVLAGLALNCRVAGLTRFDRKNYMYPDLPRGYQISQYDMPVCKQGYLEIETDSGPRRIGIRRLHMEEDAGKNLHPDDGSGMSYVDFNRCGTPLLEIVSEPELRSPEEAVRYVQGIREIMSYLGVSDCNMEEGSLRCDANINLWIYENGKRFATPIAEIKNMNSFKAIRTALQYEVERQGAEWQERHMSLEEAGKSTRGYQESTGTTVLQREKEEAAEYRYFPEPDLKPIRIQPALVERLKGEVGELPAAKRERLVRDYGLSELDALTLSASRALCDYFEEASRNYKEPRRVASWIITELSAVLNARGVSIGELGLAPAWLRELLELVDSGVISGKQAKEVFAEMPASGIRPAEIVEQKGLRQITDAAALEDVVERIMEENPKSVADYRSGKEKAQKFLMGRIMKITRGQANPALTNEILLKKLKR